MKSKTVSSEINETDKKNCVQPKAEKQYAINKCRRHLYDAETYLTMLVNEVKIFTRKLQHILQKVSEKHFHDGNCSQKMKDFLMSNIINDTIPHFYIVWKILKSPPLECPIIAGYKWILRPAPICAGMLERNFMCCLIH